MEYVVSTIKERRIELGWSLGKLDRACGFSECTMSKVERGVKVLSLRSLMKVCDALGLRMSFMKAEDDDCYCSEDVNGYDR